MYSLAENLKKFRSPERAEFENQIEREAEEKRTAPIRAAQAEQSRLLEQIRDVEKKTVLTGRDPEWITPASLPKSMAKDKCVSFVTDEAKKLFALEEFTAYDTKTNRDAICDYLTRNGVDQFANLDCFLQAFRRLRDLGCLTEKPAEPEQPAPAHEPLRFGEWASDLLQVNMDDPESLQAGLKKLEAMRAEMQQSNPEAAEHERSRAYYEDKTFTDPLTLKTYTAYQLDHDPEVTAEVFRRCHKIPRGPNTYTPRDGAMHR